MSADWLRLKGVPSIGKALASEQITENLISFYNWAMLGIGAFYNVTLATASSNNDRSRLRLAKNYSYTDGQLWESFAKDWIWESGVEGYSPIQISGVWVNGAFHSVAESGVYSHKINYRDGNILFNTAIPTNSVVRCEHSYRFVNFISADVPYFRQVLDAASQLNSQYFTTGSGHWNTNSQLRQSLSLVGISTSPTFNLRPLELGNGQNILLQDVSFTILAESRQDRNKIKDILMYQNDRSIRMYDKNLAPNSLNYDGTLYSGAMIYPSLVTSSPSGYYNKLAWFKQTEGRDSGQNGTISLASIRTKIQMDLDSQ